MAGRNSQIMEGGVSCPHPHQSRREKWHVEVLKSLELKTVDRRNGSILSAAPKQEKPHMRQ